MKLIATKNFIADLVLERSCTPVPEPMGTFQNEMNLYVAEDGTQGFIEWNYSNDDEDDGVEIGLWFEDKKVTDYDGVFELSSQAIEFLEENGYDCSDVK